ncbi:hypothetical protein FOXYSP1_15382 [Fusarium oxysporum f. sp. phaseoli]
MEDLTAPTSRHGRGLSGLPLPTPMTTFTSKSTQPRSPSHSDEGNEPWIASFDG